jgi:hypothetical protein
MNTDYTICNEQIISNKYLFLDPGFDIKKLVQPKPKPPQKTYTKSYSSYSKSNQNPTQSNQSNQKPSQSKYVSNDKTKEKDYDSDYCDFIDNEECNFIDDTSIPVIQTSKEKKTSSKKSESVIQNMINSKTIKHTEFNKNENKDQDNTFIRKYDLKYNKNTNTSKFKSFETNENDSCDFID